MSLALANISDNLISVSDFSQGKAGKIFSDVEKNNKEYIVLKNNQPTAVVLSMKEYKKTQEMLAKLEKLLDKAENVYLMQLASGRSSSRFEDFESFAEKQGFSMRELEEMSESVDIE